MIVYEVNLEVDTGVAEAFGEWLRDHIADMLGIEGFVTAQVFRQAPEDMDGAEADRMYWTVHYTVSDRQHLDAYLAQHAERMRGDGRERFGEQFRAWRRILESFEL